MELEFDCIIVLPNQMDINGNLNEECKARVQLASQYYFANQGVSFITSGGKNKQGSSICIGNQLRKHAVLLGVKPDKIITDLNSLDTVGDALFTKMNIVRKTNWKNILVTTSDYHVERSKYIFEYIFGSPYNIKVVGCPTNDPARLKLAEKKSLRTFKSMFHDLNSGDDDSLNRRLMEKHPFYKNEPRP